MRRLRYQVASSLDGYIASAKGDLDWIVMDPEIDFGELFKQFDTLNCAALNMAGALSRIRSNLDTRAFYNFSLRARSASCSFSSRSICCFRSSALLRSCSCSYSFRCCS